MKKYRVVYMNNDKIEWVVVEANTSIEATEKETINGTILRVHELDDNSDIIDSMKRMIQLLEDNSVEVIVKGDMSSNIEELGNNQLRQIFLQVAPYMVNDENDDNLFTFTLTSDMMVYETYKDSTAPSFRKFKATKELIADEHSTEE